MDRGGRRPKVGLVLGAGGVLGGAWTAGALYALVSETGWDPNDADYIVGTSAGSVLAALIAGGVPPCLMLPDSAAELFQDLIGPSGALVLAAGRANGNGFPTLPLPVPGSWRLSVSGIRHPRTEMLRLLTGLLPRGFFSTEPIKSTVRRVVHSGWVRHPNCWIVACDYTTGERVAFGQKDAPPADMADAVAASCAIPGFYRPVEIGGHHYVDGGLHSMSNVDLLAGLGLDLVICLSPMSTRAQLRSWDPMAQIAAATRRLGTSRLDREVAKLQAGGTRVLVLEPQADDLAAIGHNVMNARRRNEVVQLALETVGKQLRSPAMAADLALIRRRLSSGERRAARAALREKLLRPFQRPLTKTA